MNIKELYEIAKNELEVLTTLKNADFRLEQAEYNRDEKVWEVVVSFLVDNPNKTAPFGALSVGLPFQRIYKKLKIDEEKKIIAFYIFDN